MTRPLAIGAMMLLAALPMSARGQAAGAFTIAGETFTPDEILDARAMPDIGGTASITITLAPEAAGRLAAITRAREEKPAMVVLDGEALGNPEAPIVDGVLTIAGDFDVGEAEALAKRISGKDPLPEEFEESEPSPPAVMPNSFRYR